MVLFLMIVFCFNNAMVNLNGIEFQCLCILYSLSMKVVLVKYGAEFTG